MKVVANRKLAFVVASALVVSGAFAGQGILEVVKIFGVGAAVKQFGPQINRTINSLSGHHDTGSSYTKVVPIITAGIGGGKSVGAAQVMGPKSKVDLVQAVAQFQQQIFGNEVQIRAMIPISSREVFKDIKKVDGVGVSGIVDLKIRL